MSKIDVVIPCYNYRRFLAACVESVLAQSIADLRVLIIDDASSDNSVAVARALAQADRRISVIAHARNQGNIKTYNEGIAWAESDYFLLLSADDLLAPGAFARAIRVMDDNPDVVLTHGRCVTWQDGQPRPEIGLGQNDAWARQDLIGEISATAMNAVYTPTAIARTRIQKLIGGYDPSLPHSGDMEMWLCFAVHGAVARIDAVQAIYRKHGAAMSNSYGVIADFLERKKAFDSFFRKYPSARGESDSLKARANRSLAREAFRVGILRLRRGNIGSAVQLLRWSMQVDPQLRYQPPVWQLLKMPGAEGRAWAASQVKSAADKMLGRI